MAEYQDKGFKFSETGIKMIFERTQKSQTKIFGGYHATTAIFAVLFSTGSSIISY